MDDLLREFLTETNESLDVADVELVKFEQDPNNAEILNNIFRLVHTIKGTCGFIGLPRLALLAHAAETLMDRFREGVPVTPEAVSLVLQTVDRIKEILIDIENDGGREPAGSDVDLISGLEAMAAGSGGAAAEAEPQPQPQPSAGMLVDQVLERPLMPGEIPLDELERMFRETEVERPVKAEVPAVAPGAPAAAEAESAEAAAYSGPERRRQAGEEAAAGGVSSQSIRVNVDVLEHLMTMVSELVLTRNQLMEIARRQEDSDFKVSLQRLSTVTAELQEGVMRTRMQPIGHAWQKLPRIVRDLAQDLGKQIDLDMLGAETELDRQVLDLIKDPLTHMVRNSADHGLEGPEARRAAGKPEKGTIRLSAFHEGGHIIIEIADDGRGLNTDRIRAKALENHLATDAELAKMGEGQIHRFIFAAGFSTAEKVTSVSGRGVGMDVVRSNIEKIGGTVDVRSVAGRGSTFVIKIPLTLAIVPALIVEAAGERFAVPQLAVVELVRIQPGSEHRIERIKDAPVLRLRDKLLPITHLGRLLGAEGDLSDEHGFIAVMQVGNQSFGVIVDAVFHTEEIVVKPMSSMLRHIGMFSGSTILGDGRVIMIIDPNGIAQAAASAIEAPADEVEKAVVEQQDGVSDKVALLLFRAGSSEPKAVPLSLVTRLEEFSHDKIEHSHDRPLLNYRGGLIPLVFAGGAGVADGAAPRHPMLVFSDNGRTMGLVVDEIVDIVEEPFAIDLPSETPGILGTGLVGGKAVEIVDISYHLSVAFPDWFDGRRDDAAANRPRLLLLDPSAFFRNMMEPVLRSIGFEVSVAASVAEAEALVSRPVPLVALMADVETPGVAELAAHLRRQPAHAQTGLIGLVGTADPYGNATGAAFDTCVSKLDRAGIVATVRSCTRPRYGEAA